MKLENVVEISQRKRSHDTSVVLWAISGITKRGRGARWYYNASNSGDGIVVQGLAL